MHWSQPIRFLFYIPTAMQPWISIEARLPNSLANPA